jgi:hypothetical protein
METRTRRRVYGALGALATLVLAAPAHAQVDAEAESLRQTMRAPFRRGHSPGAWEVAPAVVARAGAVSRPELREMLLPVLITAYQYRADGYDSLWGAVCTDDGAMSSERARACSTLPAKADKQWRQEHRREAWASTIGLSAGYAIIVTATYLGRSQPESRRTAEAAGFIGGGILVGSLVGGTVGWALRHSWDSSEMDRAKAWAAGTGIAGVIAGGVAGALAARSAPPGARAPVTAVGLGLVVPFVALAFE